MSSPSTVSPVAEGLRRALPIVLGYVPVAFAFGVLAVKSNIPPALVVAMSVFHFAGSGQFVCAGLWGAGVGAMSVIVAVFVVNLRHLLMSAALAPFLRSWSKTRLALFSYQMTDETFALHASRFAKGETAPCETFGINVIAQSAWVGGTVLGLAASTLITDIRPIGLDYALPAMFIALLAGQVKSRTHLAVALFSGILSTALVLSGVDRFGVLAATLAGAALGTLWQSLTKPTSS